MHENKTTRGLYTTFKQLVQLIPLRKSLTRITSKTHTEERMKEGRKS